MKKPGSKNSKPLYAILIASVLLAVLLAVGYYSFFTGGNARIAAAQEQALTRRAEQQRQYTDNALGGRFAILDALAIYLGNGNVNGSAVFAEVAAATLEGSGFDALTLFDGTGAGLDSAGNAVRLPSDDGYSSVLAGSRLMRFDSNGAGGVCVLAVPVRYDDGAAGVLAGEIGTEKLNALLMKYSDSIFAMAVDADGKTVFYAENGVTSAGGGDMLATGFFSVITEGSIEQVGAAMRDGRALCVRALRDGDDVFLTQTPLGYNGWTYFSAVPAELIIGDLGFISSSGGKLIVYVAALFAVYIAFLVFTMQRSRKLLRIENERVVEEKLKLALSEERYRLLAQDSEDIIFEANLAQHTIETNDNFVKMFGEPPRYEWMLSGHRLIDADREHYRDIISRARNSRNLTSELRMLDKNGLYRWFLLHFSVINDENGNIARVVGKLTDIDKRKRETELLELKAQTDAATGLYNKTATGELIARALSASPNVDSALMIVDIDNLKTINDTLGHAQGDRAIAEFAAALKSHFRATDVIGRIGGDEFMVFASGIKSDVWLNNTAASLVRKLASIRVGENDDFTIHGSIGAAITGGKTGFDELYKRADTALYQVKRHGKNGYAVYTAEMDSFSYEYSGAAQPSLRASGSLDNNELNRLVCAVSVLFPLVVSANLTKNSYFMMECDRATAESLPANGSYDELVARRANTMHPDDRAGFLAAFSREHMALQFAAGNRQVEFAGRQLGGDGTYRKINTVAVLTGEDGAGNICQICFSRPAGDENPAENT